MCYITFCKLYALKRVSNAYAVLQEILYCRRFCSDKAGLFAQAEKSKCMLCRIHLIHGMRVWMLIYLVYM